MCEMCGCGVGKGVPRAVEAAAPVTLAAIPVRIVEPSAAGKRLQPQRQQGIKDPLLQRAPRSP